MIFERYMMKHKTMIAVLVVLAVGIVIQSWMLLKGPALITPETLQLSKIRWARLEDIEHIRPRKVIAIAFMDGKPGLVVTPLYASNWPIAHIETDPVIINRFVEVLLNIRRGDAGFENNPPAGQNHYLQFVCSDNTGVSIGYEILPRDDKVVYGVGWASCELRTLLKEYDRANEPYP